VLWVRVKQAAWSVNALTQPRIFLGAYRIVLVFVEHGRRNNGRMRLRWLDKIEALGVAVWVLGILALGASSILQRSITLAWDPSTDPSVAGYRLYVGSVSGVYTTVINAGSATTATVPGLTVGATYYFAVTAYNSLGVDSPFSGEIEYVVPPPPNTLQTSQIAGARVINGAGWKSGQAYNILASLDLVSWQVIGAVTADASGSFQFADPASGSYPSRFYRAETISPPRRLQISPIAGAKVIRGTGWNAGQTCKILASQDLVSWQVISMVTADALGSFQFTNPAGSSYPSRFYRAEAVSFPSPRRLQINLVAGAGVINGAGWNNGQTCNILASQDLVSWQVIGRATAGASGSFQFTDPASSSYRSRFYRAETTSP
jgi:hypothetical protein